MISPYLNKPLRAHWQACRDIMPQVTGARFTFTDQSGETDVDVSLVLDWHIGARAGKGTVEFRVFRNGRSIVPSQIMSHCDDLDAYFIDCGKGPVAHYCPASVIEDLRAECIKYLDRGRD